MIVAVAKDLRQVRGEWMGSTRGFWPARRPAVAALLALSLATASCTSHVGGDSSSSGAPPNAGAASAAKVTVTPANALVDEPVAIKITGLAPGVAVKVTATATDDTGVEWTANAQVTADSTGIATLDEQSAGGSYTGINPMGLFENMKPVKGSAVSFVGPNNGYPVEIAASVAETVVARASTRRLDGASAGVITTNVTPAESGLFGELFRPKNLEASRPSVMLLGGSEGGLSTAFLARTLAAHGYPTLALAYFGEPGLPSALADIPLEYFVKGLKLLAAQPGVDKSKVTVFGVSRGSEAALLLGADFPDLVHGVIVGSPSMVVFSNPNNANQAAWTLGGRPVTYASADDFRTGTTDPTDARQAVIPVEEIKGPILTFCGGLDSLWHSCDYSKAITKRLNASAFGYEYAALTYPDAGHLVGCACSYMSFTSTAGWGGTINDNAIAQAKADQQMLTWLSQR